MECIFCKIANKEIPADIIVEQEGAVAFLDRNPIAPGHTLVIPTVHAATVDELPEAAVLSVFTGVQAAVKLLREKLVPAGFTIGINHGTAAGQAIGHFHVHVIPRFPDDNGGNVHSIVQNPPASYDAIKQKVFGNG